ncbi:hypothetical protein TUBRATIS_002920 [Tubulinosema ratisbonensis]|uniref:Uncharacterized protein n=1 Tax=Tubulinosema ratisbonensis TaxID=291195 RepID=A0A437APR3_9MICR|nr:hypothetical protein TUBRATIS_002920 [Tubulinosema ratisbonensis]
MKKDLTLGGKKKYKFKPKLTSTTEPTTFDLEIQDNLTLQDIVYTPTTSKSHEKTIEKDKTYELTEEAKEMKFLHDYDPQVILFKNKEILSFENEDEFVFEVGCFEGEFVPLRIEDEVVFEVIDGKANELGIVKQLYFIN